MIRVENGQQRLERLRRKRPAEDDRQVCMERAKILDASKAKYASLSHTLRQAAVLRDLCEQITCVIEPEDLLAGRMPEVVPTQEEERFIATHPDLFCEPGAPGWLDSLSIYVPEWDRLVRKGLGGIAAEARKHLAEIQGEDGEARREFMTAAIQALEAVSTLIRRYAEKARADAARQDSGDRREELLAMAERCEQIAWEAPKTFAAALQLIQIVHMILSCLVGGRDVTPGRVDQYLFELYRDDLMREELNRDDAVVLLAMFFLRLSQMAGSGTDFDDSVRRTPCKYTHLYVTVGGTDAEGNLAVNELTYAVLDAIGLLNYREPTLLARYRVGAERAFAEQVARLVRDRRPVTIYNDDIVVRALTRQGVALKDARGYAHSACHNVIVVGREAGSGPGAFHNLPRLLLLAMNAGRDPMSGAQAGAPTPGPSELRSFDDFWGAFREQVRFALANTRRSWETRWRQHYGNSCPLLQSCLMEYSFEQQKPCWQAAPVSHFNHCLLGLGTTVDSLTTVRELVFEQKELPLWQFNGVLRDNWDGHAALRERIRTRLPRYGQDNDEARQLAAKVGRMWVEEVEDVSRGMSRLQMWPSFYSHLVHVHGGKQTPATPDGRRHGDPISENQSPSFGTPNCSPTSILRAMSALPFDHTPSGAASLTLAATDVEGEEGVARIIGLVETYFKSGGLHLQFNVLDAGLLEKAMESPEHYSDLMVRVAGFSANFTRLSRDVQQDLVRRYRRDGAGG